MANEMKETLIKKPKASVYIFCWMIYLIPLPFYLLFASYNRMFTPAEFFKILFQPLSFIYSLIYIVLCFLLNRSGIKGVMTYDGSPKSIDKVNSVMANFASLNIALPVINSFVFPMVLNFSSKRAHIGNIELIPLIGMACGFTFLLSLFSYVNWIEKFEPWACIVPFEKKHMDKNMNLVKRYVFTYGFSLIGIIFLIAAPLLMKANAEFSTSWLFMTTVLPIVIMGFIVGVFDFIVMTRGVTNRIRIVQNFTNDLSKGYYTAETLDILSREEVGLLFSNVNDFYVATKGFLGDVNTNIITSNDIADRLRMNMSETAGSVNQIVANVTNVKESMGTQAVSVEEANSSTGEIMSNIENLSKSIETQSAAVEESSAAVRQMVANIQSVTNILNKNAKAVNELGDASELGHNKVEEAVRNVETVLNESAGLLEASTVIQNIAEQTNLLAMNAAIEAAHAGESGKGFAVVADEIRKLAEQSNVQGKNISESLQKLSEVISGVATSTKDLQQQFEIIFELTKTVKEQEQYVMNAMQEQNEGSTQILEAMRDIDDSTTVVKQGSSEMVESGKHVAKEMRLLSDTTDSVNKMIEEIVSGTDRIHTAMDEINADSELNKDSVGKLIDGISNFILE